MDLYWTAFRLGKQTRSPAEAANKSAQLAAAITRPFLNVAKLYLEEAHGGYDALIRVSVRNTGNLPADRVSIGVFLLDDWSEPDRGRPLGEDVVLPSVCFPGGTELGPSRHILSPKERRLIDGMWVQVRIAYRNRDTGTNHETIRGFSVRSKGMEFIPDGRMDSWK